MGGFSQGGAVSLYTALRHDESLAGIIALSTYLPLADRLDEDISAENRDIPIFMGHGQMDPLVPLSLAEQGLETLRAHHYSVTWKTYPIPHSVSPLEFQDLSAWFGRSWVNHKTYLRFATFQVIARDCEAALGDSVRSRHGDSLPRLSQTQ